MARGSRGLPPSFTIEVPRGALAPVQLGDYLEEEDRAPVQPRRLPQPPVPAQPAARNVLPMQRWSSAPPVEKVEAPDPQVLDSRRFSRPVPRKQLNMNPETLRMVDELLDHIQTYSVQKDAKASEMFHGLVSALYEARELLNFSAVQPRGRWGTPTARAFPVALKNAFQDAIADWHRRNG